MNNQYQNRILTILPNTKQIRNVCIIAHVDHGKTTLSDNLLGSNEIISEFQAGKLRYLDSREDEQEREITMKSSAVCLLYKDYPIKQQFEEDKIAKADTLEIDFLQIVEDKESPKEDYLINLIDSPGHIAFAFEVSSGLRVCDGAILIIDVVEGVCSQTITNLRKAVDQGLSIILFINKLDKLINEGAITPSDAYEHFQQLIDSANAALSIALSQKVIAEFGDCGNPERLYYLEKIYSFSPLKGNVIFGSAYDNWGFSIDDFLDILATKFKFKPEALRKLLWGHYYFNPTTRKVTKKPSFDDQKIMFVDLILKHVFSIYEKVRYEQDVNWINKMVKKFNAKIQEYMLKDVKTNWQTLSADIMKAWLPLHKTIFFQTIRRIPDPQISQQMRLTSICKKLKKIKGNKEMFQKFIPFTKGIENADKNGPIIMFISKMNRIKQKNIRELPVNHPKSLQAQKGEKIIAFARVFSGTLSMGDTVKIQVYSRDLSGGKDCEATEIHYVERKVNHIYFWMGQMLQAIPVAYPGMIIGIGDVEDLGFKTATISNFEDFPNLTGINFEQNQLKVSLKTENLQDMSTLIAALKKVLMADPVVEVYYNEIGDLIIETAGEVHLERCLKDIEEDMKEIKVIVSDPIISFKETIICDKYKLKRDVDKELRLKILQENVKAFKEDLDNDRAKKFESTQIEEISGEETKNKSLEEDTLKPESPQEEKPELNPWEEGYFTESSGMYESTPEEEEVPVKKPTAKIKKNNKSKNKYDSSEEYDHDKDIDAKVDMAQDMRYTIDNSVDEIEYDSRFLQGKSEFLYQEKRDELITVTRKVKTIKMDKINFLDLKKKQNYCDNLTPSGDYRLSVRAIGLDQEVASWLASNKSKMRKLFAKDTIEYTAGQIKFLQQFLKVLEKSSLEKGIVKLIIRYMVCFGPRKSGNNILCMLFSKVDDSLFGRLKDHPDFANYFKHRKTMSTFDYTNQDVMEKYYPDINFTELSKSLENGFNVTLEHGPLCGEEMSGCVFIVEDFESIIHQKDVEKEKREQLLKKKEQTHETNQDILEEQDIQESKDIYKGNFGPVSGQLLSTMKQCCLNAFLGADPRLVQGLLEVNLFCEEFTYGRTVEVLNRRKSKILENDYQELTQMFIVKALLPMQESIGFYNDMMSTTQGRVMPETTFHSWSIIDEDPFYQPVTEDELEEHGNKIFTKNHTRGLIEKIRERKGINTDEKIVVAADKQDNTAKRR